MNCPRCESKLEFMTTERDHNVTIVEYICLHCMSWIRDRWLSGELVGSEWADMRSKNK